MLGQYIAEVKSCVDESLSFLKLFEPSVDGAIFFHLWFLVHEMRGKSFYFALNKLYLMFNWCYLVTFIKRACILQ